uniref:Holin n=2 Tax=Vibrio TaxID=662 RepID=A0A0H3ZT69_9VIBR|nr:hypothetical protein [Vibrio cyclitrophicus]AKN38227.1 hypothetical protein [Vibrio splendidus]
MDEVFLELFPKTSEALVTVLLSLLGGLGSYLHGVRTGRIQRALFEFVTEVFLAQIVGFIVMNACRFLDLPPSLTAVLILALTNNSDESILEFKSYLMHRLRGRIGMKPNGAAIESSASESEPERKAEISNSFNGDKGA